MTNSRLKNRVQRTEYREQRTENQRVGASLVGARNYVSGDFSVAMLLRNDNFAVFARCIGAHVAWVLLSPYGQPIPPLVPLSPYGQLP